MKRRVTTTVTLFIALLVLHALLAIISLVGFCLSFATAFFNPSPTLPHIMTLLLNGSLGALQLILLSYWLGLTLDYLNRTKEKK